MRETGEIQAFDFFILQREKYFNKLSFHKKRLIFERRGLFMYLGPSTTTSLNHTDNSQAMTNVSFWDDPQMEENSFIILKGNTSKKASNH